MQEQDDEEKADESEEDDERLDDELFSAETGVGKGLTVPRGPANMKEYLDHMVCHVPYRNWCELCVRGRGTSDAHKRSSGTREIPVVSIDFAYLGDGDEDKLLPIMVGKDSSSSYLLAEPLPTKHNLRASARGLCD